MTELGEEDRGQFVRSGICNATATHCRTTKMFSNSRLTRAAEQMRLGTIAVRDAFGQDVPGITDKDIQEALWHYYYDLDKSVNYLLQKAMPKEEKKKKTKGGSLFSHFMTRIHMGRHAGAAGSQGPNTRDLGGASPPLMVPFHTAAANFLQLRSIWKKSLLCRQ